MRRNTEADIWAKVLRKQPDECWEWLGAHNYAGYPVGNWQCRQVRINRLILLFISGECPADMQACHTCDNPQCVNPEHLYWGTPAENCADREERGHSGAKRYPERMVRGHGESHYASKLTDAQVEEIRMRYAAGNVRQEDLGREYGIGQSQVGRIVRHESRVAA